MTAININSLDESILSLAETIAKNYEHIIFNLEKHSYATADGKSYLSVSELISQYTPRFKSEEVATKVAKREGVSTAEMLARWDIRRDFSTAKGSEFHLYVEKYLKEGRKINIITPIFEEIAEFHRFWDKKYQQKFDIVEAEFIVADDDLLVAGTIDLLVKNKQDDKYYIFDWKTNQSIKLENHYSTLHEPVEHLENSVFNKYRLQTSIYKALLERTIDIKIEDIYLIHFSEDIEQSAIPCTHKFMHCGYLEKEVLDIFQERVSSLKNQPEEKVK